jgi:hypothetical protein
VLTKLYLLSLVLALGLLASWAGSASAAGEKRILGFVERAVISEYGFEVKARLDTGATTSSLDARNIRRFRRGGERFVRFDVEDRDSGETVTLERPLVRDVRIRQIGGPPERRPVVKMWVCVADLMQEVEVNLTARTDFLYPFLVGRSAMAGKIIVDPGTSLTTRPKCDLGDFSK